MDIFYKLYLHRTIKLINLQLFNEKTEIFYFLQGRGGFLMETAGFLKV